ncbi:aminoacyl-tRNA deacylase [Halodesulfovibrio marinisediminis]|uniref:Cys-tRNA(Pro) deacylase, prolyl-tRNA editing enzyme YbaK/EbsC n=1 Tax=Halodesulfovibrio marinisediminis DSM 17456 TaxID=1121457 RepID=A0A1N6I3W1_9BACT|nr:YbaK/EbsC family protein [Halodesulfovibrio marinisediminis]SIO26671.1 Cys-tRNA(Pro) deacylase, prolyl-tRNA editing enzyme YbaK/EbsC [Halodesulfovibrio marinisediminis DSM 17456]
MKTYEDKLSAYLTGQIPSAEHLVFEQSCHSVAEAAEAADASPDELVKNVCMVDSDNNLIVAIVRGADRVSTSRVGKALGVERPRMATFDEVLEKTTYPCGGVPSFGYSAVFLVDTRVTELESVLSGGGSERALVRVNTKDLLQANNAQVVRVRK